MAELKGVLGEGRCWPWPSNGGELIENSGEMVAQQWIFHHVVGFEQFTGSTGKMEARALFSGLEIFENVRPKLWKM